MKYLNLGCGNRFHPAWINIDITAAPGVLAHDLSRGVPMAQNSCDVVYHSAVLEHMRRADALPFLRECFRVLKAGGIIRVAVPDLELICRLYLQKMDEAAAGDAQSWHDYEWMMLELCDQMVREHPGGAMATYLAQPAIPNLPFVLERIGEEGRTMLNSHNQSAAQPGLTPSRITRAVRRRLGSGLNALSDRLLRLVILVLCGRHDWRALQIGRFRLAGEVHHWMYDRYSLCKLLETVGFCNITVVTATQSRIPEWNTFHLDALPDGTVIKPDSLFIEATKPSK
jgi:SAM-dependent methyltransferase